MDDLFYLFHFAAKLKDLKREGWVKRGIQNPESVASHSYSVALLSIAYAKKLGLDSGRCTELALVHDLAESVVSDIIPSDPRYKEKDVMEKKAIEKICNETGMEFIKALFMEYTLCRTKEAKLVHDMDKIDMLLQALHYERKTKKDLAEFFDYTKGKLLLKESRKIYDEIVKERLK